MSPLWTSADIAEATGGVAHGVFGASGVAFDSREVEAGDLFVALPGAATDGQRFVAAAFVAGAKGALVAAPVDGPHVQVADVRAALQALGRAGRARAGAATVFGVTGSVGKTSVKEALWACLAEQGAAHRSVRSYNNHVGVPLSLARMPEGTRWAVFEMGMNHRHEIAPLSRMVRPHVAVITWVGVAHIENLGSEMAIAEEKADIFLGLEPGGWAIIPHDSVWREQLRARALAAGARVLTFGLGAGADVRGRAERGSGGGLRLEADVRGRGVTLTLPRPGEHLAGNALAVLAAVSAGGGDVAAAARVLEALDAPPGRGRVLRSPGGARVLDEAYNANPDSMAAALGAMAAMDCRGVRRAVLGAMRELGPEGARYHRELGARVRDAGIADLIVVGEGAEALADAVPGALWVADWQTARDAVRARLGTEDLLLVKGSNSTGLGALVAALTGPED